MFIYPLFRMTAARVPGISFIVQGPEIATDPPITVSLKDADGISTNLVVRKRLVDGVMFVHAEPPMGAMIGSGLGMDGGVGSVSVTVTGTSDQISAEVGYGEPGIGVTSGPPPV